MRLLASVVLLGMAVSATAIACPRDASCLVISMRHDRAAPIAGERAPEPAPTRTIAFVRLPTAYDPVVAPPRVQKPALALGRDAVMPRPVDAEADEMPWIWRVLRKSVYDRMPTYEGTAGQQTFTLVLSPVVVSGSFDTVPGVGLAGDF